MLIICDIKSYEKIAQIRSFAKEISCMSISSDDKYVATGSPGGKICVWDIDKRSLEFILKSHYNWIDYIKFTKDSNVLFNSSGQTMNLFNYQQKKLEICSSKHVILIKSVQITKNSKYLITGSRDYTVRIWKLNPNFHNKDLKNNFKYKINSENRLALTAKHNNNKFKQILFEKQGIYTFDGHIQRVDNAIIDQKNTFAATKSLIDGTIRIWDLVNRKQKMLIPNTTCLCCVISNDNKLLVTGLINNDIHIWNLFKGKTKTVLKGHIGSIQALSITPNDCFLISGSEDTTVIIWDLKTTRSIKIFHTCSVFSLQILENQSFFLSSSPYKNEAIYMWNFQNLNEEPNLLVKNGYFTCIKLTRDQTQLICGSSINPTEIYNLSTRALCGMIAQIIGVRSLDTSWNNKYWIFGMEESGIKIWNVNEGRQEFEFYEKSWGTIYVIIAMKDNKSIVAGCEDKTIRIFDFIQMVVLCELIGHKEAVMCLVITDDEKTLISRTDASCIRKWSIEERRMISSEISDEVVKQCLSEHHEFKDFVEGFLDFS